MSFQFFRMSIFTLISWSILFFAVHVYGIPESDICDEIVASSNQVLRIRDLTDCSKFYYCVQGLQNPYPGQCPQDPGKGLQLYFNPNTTNCDFASNVPKTCFRTGGGDGGSESTTEPVELEPSAPELTSASSVTSSTTTKVKTTTKPPRPPKLNDKNDLVIDCSKHPCGIFPNTYGSCDTYVVCSNGVKKEKRCHGGQLFDITSKECQPPSGATCWTEPTAPTHHRNGNQTVSDCPYHGNPPTTPLETLSRDQGGGVILRNPIVTNWGSWQKWVICPNGTYATGIYAWRRLLMQGSNWDHAGIVSLSFRCQSPGGSETTKFIASAAPNYGYRDGWPMYYMCRGAVIGFRLNSVNNRGLRGDQIATDNIQALCSCSGPAYKPYEQQKYYPQNGHRGQWTQSQFCEKGQAVCGMQTQMHEYKEYQIGRYDNTGLNNIKIKCCEVPDPLETCVAKESRVFVRTCDNKKTQGQEGQEDQSLRCDFESVVGLGMDYEGNRKLADFYSSVGYEFQESNEQMLSKIVDRLLERDQGQGSLEYPWDEVDPSMDKDETVTPQTLYIPPGEKHDVFQIVAKCSYLQVRSNRYVRVRSTSSGSTEEFFEV